MASALGILRLAEQMAVSRIALVHTAPLWQGHSHSGVYAMLHVGRDDGVATDVYAGAGTFLERDDGGRFRK